MASSLLASLRTLGPITQAFAESYASTPVRLKILDAYSAAAVLTAAVLFVYAKLVGSFPFNAFLAALFCCVGCFVLTTGLRMQAALPGSRPELAFGGYALAMCTLFLAAWNYVG